MTTLILAYTLGISVVFSLPKDCQTTETYYYYAGCWLSDKRKTIYINPKLKGRQRIHTILHELGHSQGYIDERKADSYAGVMMKKYKW